jgi:hypothetical protein
VLPPGIHPRFFTSYKTQIACGYANSIGILKMDMLPQPTVARQLQRLTPVLAIAVGWRTLSRWKKECDSTACSDEPGRVGDKQLARMTYVSYMPHPYNRTPDESDVLLSGSDRAG